MAVNPHHR